MLGAAADLSVTIFRGKRTVLLNLVALVAAATGVVIESVAA